MTVNPTRLTLIVVAVLVTAVVWVLGSIGFAQYTEDLCFEDGDLYGYGAYSQTIQQWPPSVQCELRGGPGQPDLTTDHRLLGAAIIAWWYGFPVGSAVGWVIASVSVFRRSAGRISGES